MNDQPDTQAKRERLTKLFEFLKAYTDLRFPPVRDINQQLRTLWLKDLPAHSSVELFQDTGKTDDESEDSAIVLPQFYVGAYRIDLVVTGNGRRLAVECDGERWHGLEKLQEDAERQAILERLGWKFVRIRGSLFFRDEDRALMPMFGRLTELNITPELELGTVKASAKAEVVERVIRRAQELQASWHSNEETADNNFFLKL